MWLVEGPAVQQPELTREFVARIEADSATILMQEFDDPHVLAPAETAAARSSRTSAANTQCEADLRWIPDTLARKDQVPELSSPVTVVSPGAGEVFTLSCSTARLPHLMFTNRISPTHQVDKAIRLRCV